jgi:catechol 2,3-dioxygenase-like lactoylglutathione lyase family enzyme
VPTILRPHHTGIQVADLERSVAFYRDILGFELVFQWNPRAEYIRTIVGYPGADIHAAILRMPGSDTFLEILEYRNVERTPVDTRTGNPGTAHIAFFTDDCDGLYAELTAKGVRSVSEPVTPTIGPNKGGRAVYMIDPDGIRVEFIQTARSFGEFTQDEASTLS